MGGKVGEGVGNGQLLQHVPKCFKHESWHQHALDWPIRTLGSGSLQVISVWVYEEGASGFETRVYNLRGRAGKDAGLPRSRNRVRIHLKKTNTKKRKTRKYLTGTNLTNIL